MKSEDRTRPRDYTDLIIFLPGSKDVAKFLLSVSSQGRSKIQKPKQSQKEKQQVFSELTAVDKALSGIKICHQTSVFSWRVYSSTLDIAHWQRAFPVQPTTVLSHCLMSYITDEDGRCSGRSHLYDSTPELPEGCHMLHLTVHSSKSSVFLDRSLKVWFNMMPLPC